MAGAVLCGPCNAHVEVQSWWPLVGAGLGVQISWQAQDFFVDLEVQISWQVQDFMALERRFRGRRRTFLWTLKCRFRGRCRTLWSADFVAGAGLCGLGVQISWQAQEFLMWKCRVGGRSRG